MIPSLCTYHGTYPILIRDSDTSNSRNQKTEWHLAPGCQFKLPRSRLPCWINCDENLILHGMSYTKMCVSGFSFYSQVELSQFNYRLRAVQQRRWEMCKRNCLKHQLVVYCQNLAFFPGLATQIEGCQPFHEDLDSELGKQAPTLAL